MRRAANARDMARSLLQSIESHWYARRFKKFRAGKERSWTSAPAARAPLVLKQPLVPGRAAMARRPALEEGLHEVHKRSQGYLYGRDWATEP